MYAIVKTGGKQYRVEQGQSLLVERLPIEDGDRATLQPLLYVDGDNVVDGDGLAKVSVQARVLGHERGPKLRVVKFKPKRGYKRRTGHRQELTRIEVTEIKFSERGASSRRSPKPVAADAVGEEAMAGRAVSEEPVATARAEEKPKRSRSRKPASEEPAASGASEAASEAAEAESKPARPRRRRAAAEAGTETSPSSEPEESDGS